MGATKWRAQELILLEKIAASEDSQKQLKKSHTDRREGRSYWFRNATYLFVMKYREAFSGCFEILAGIAINVGADASFFSLFDEETVFTLFEHEFQLFQVS